MINLSWKKILAAILVFLGVFFASGEMLARLFFTQRLTWQRENKYLVSENVPNFRGKYITKEFSTNFKFNENGMRGKAIPYARDSRKARAFIIGDSFVASLEVPLEDHFASLIKDNLGSNKVEILSYGCGGWDSVQELIYLKNEVIKYEPDIVIVFFYTGNDVNGNYERWYVENLSQYVDAEDLDLNYRKTQTENAIKRIKEFLLQKSFFVNMIYYATQSATWRKHVRKLSRKLDVIKIPERVESYSAIKQAAKIEKSWEITDKLLANFKKYSDEKNINLLFVLIPHVNQVYEERDVEGFEKIKNKYWGCDRGHERVIALLNKNKLDYVDLLEHFIARKKQDLYLHENDHWSKQGHRLVANVLSKRTREMFPQDVRRQIDYSPSFIKMGSLAVQKAINPIEPLDKESAKEHDVIPGEKVAYAHEG